MSDENTPPAAPATPPVADTPPTDESEAQRQEAKSALDRAYAARDASAAAQKKAEAELEKYRQKDRDAETERLKTEGKLTEAHALEKTSWETEKATISKERDEALKQVASLQLKFSVEEAIASANKEFKSERARKTAVREITDSLVKDDKGEWKAKDGKSPADFVKSYLDDSENGYLLKPPVNTGGGSSGSPAGQPKTNKKLSEMSNQELLERAKNGELSKK